jgi:hypothetical protein
MALNRLDGYRFPEIGDFEIPAHDGGTRQVLSEFLRFGGPLESLRATLEAAEAGLERKWRELLPGAQHD